jgi:hypothetical protein
MIRSSQRAVRLIACIAGLASPIGAQPPQRSVATIGCPAVTVDTVIGPAYGLLLVESPNATVPDGLLARALDALAVALIDDTLELAPATALNDIVVTAVTTRRGPNETLAPWWPGHPALASELGFSIEPSGAFTSPRLLIRGDSVTAAVLLDAVSRTRPLTSPLPSSALRVRLRLTVSPELNVGAAPLVAVRQTTTSARVGRMLPEGSAPPTYPSWAKARGIMAVVLVWYVIDERGNVVRRTVGTTAADRPGDASNYESFVKAVTDVAPSWVHDRGLAPECSPRRQVVVRVDFNIGRR